MGAKLLFLQSETNLHGIEEMLTRQGFNVIKTASVVEASTLTLKERPQCVLIYWGSANPQILEFPLWLRKEPKFKKTPILILSSDHDNKLENFTRAIEAGADDFLEFPISPFIFLSKVAAWVRRSS